MPGTSNHEDTLLRRVAAPLGLVLLCAGIFWASDQPDLRVSDDDTLDFVLRKLGHMSEYAALLLLGTATLRPHVATLLRAVTGAALFALVYACSDEYHQTFVRGRVGHPQDVGIDMVGAALGAIVLTMWHRRRSRAATAMPDHAPIASPDTDTPPSPTVSTPEEHVR